MGFALGGSVVWGFLYSPQQQNSPNNHQPDDHTSEKESKNRFWEKAQEDPTAYFTLWLVVFTGVLAVSTIGLWVVTAKGTNTQARDTRILQRAYLTAEPAGIVASGGAYSCHPNITIRNVGNLPAKKVRWVITHALNESDRFNDFPIDESAAEGDISLSPGIAMTQGGKTIKFDRSEFGKYNRLFIYIWGIIIYDDGFGEIRHSRFCHRYNGVNIDVLFTKMGAVSIVSGHQILVEYARLHRYGNDAT
ncbi:hypothetical protein [Bradyrhizobium sp. 1200_D9_N1_1]|uniref:hypothetical protein n=1 Tax=Bradyrhizobium sp. 1200_D9_N1_1 TaxID=3239013 RepID=UPI003F89D8E7